jgi:hypothetical protein
LRRAVFPVLRSDLTIIDPMGSIKVGSPMSRPEAITLSAEEGEALIARLSV